MRVKMKIQIMSDLHLEFGSIIPLKENKDTVLILAGDIHTNFIELEKYLEYAGTCYKKVIMVAGNHEFYNKEFNATIKRLRDFDIENFIFLENDIYTLEDVTFIGATMWTSPSEETWGRISDSIAIKYNNSKFSIHKLAMLNRLSSDYIKYQLTNIPGKKIVITHFGPSEELCKGSVWEGNSLNDYFWNNGFEDYYQYADLWAFGHTHSSIDTYISKCHLICNPYGYQYHSVNWNWDKNKVLEV